MHWSRRHPRGRPPHPDILTPAEWRVLELVREVQSNPDIAGELGASINGVRTHVSTLLAKLEVPDKPAFAAWDGRPAEVITGLSADSASCSRSPTGSPARPSRLPAAWSWSSTSRSWLSSRSR
jgi:DNA-binding CsgD family transcriptional regulator